MSTIADAVQDSPRTRSASRVTDGALESAGLNLTQLGAALDLTLRESTDEGAATQCWLDWTKQVVGARATVLFPPRDAEHLASQPELTIPAVSDGILGALHGLATRAIQDRTVQIARAAGDSSNLTLALPVYRWDQQPEALVVIVPAEGHDTSWISGTVQLLQFVAAWASTWRGRWESFHQDQAEHEHQRWWDTAQRAAEQTRWADAVQAWCERLGVDGGARWTAVGVRRIGGACRMVSVAPAMSFERHAALVTSLEVAMAETLLLPDDDTEAPPTDATRQLMQLAGGGCLQRMVLRDAQGQAWGACISVSDAPMSTATRARWLQGGRWAGIHLGLIRQRKSNWRQQALLRWRALSLSQRRAAVGGICVGLALICAVPIPYRIACPCEVQPITRHFVAAPYEGRLEVALVEPGDLVERDQVLARMDGHEIRLELAALDAEIEGVAKERDRAMATRDTATAQISLLEMERLQLKRELYQDRLANLEIRSPSRGVVISGDPKKVQGSRLTLGQSLLEVGPIGEMMVEVAILDVDVAHARVNEPITFRLESLPHRQYSGTLVRIQPRAETRDAQNVFMGRVQLHDATQELRPGMRGRAKVDGGYQPLVWILFHRAWEQLLFRLGW